MTNAQIGIIRGLGLAVLLAVLGFLANATNLQAFVNPATASIVAAIAVALEGIFSPQGTALLGTVHHA